MSAIILEKICQLVLRDDYELSGHALRDLQDNFYSLEDIEAAICSGTIRKKEEDELGEAIDGKKYTICGGGAAEQEFEVVGKVRADENGRLFFVITAYERYGQ